MEILGISIPRYGSISQNKGTTSYKLNSEARSISWLWKITLVLLMRTLSTQKSWLICQMTDTTLEIVLVKEVIWKIRYVHLCNGGLTVVE